MSLITRLGHTIVYTITMPGVYSPATGAAMPILTDYTIKAIVSNTGTASDLAAGSLVEGNMRKLLIAGASLPTLPSPNDVVSIDGVKYLVDSADQSYAGEFVVSHTIFVRKS